MSTYASERACRRCGSLERYRKNDRCAPCMRANARRGYRPSPRRQDAEVPDTFKRDVSLALAFLIAHQGEWQPKICIAHGASPDGKLGMAGSVEPLTLVGVVR